MKLICKNCGHEIIFAGHTESKIRKGEYFHTIRGDKK